MLCTEIGHVYSSNNTKDINVCMWEKHYSRWRIYMQLLSVFRGLDKRLDCQIVILLISQSFRESVIRLICPFVTYLRV
jgi:hypothetical protein